jgi:hypothetical protein
MPFQPITQLPAPKPRVKIFFHGLLVLHSPDGTYCHVEPHFGPHAVAHTLSIEVRVKAPNNPDVILLRLFNKPSDTVLIEVRPAQAKHAYKYLPSPLFNPAQGMATGLERGDDFRWILDFKELHPGSTLTIDTAKTRPGIIFLNGSYFFLTPQRKLNVEINPAPGSVVTAPPDRAAIASLIGANVYLDGTRQEKLVLTWSGGELPLEIPTDPDAYYEIYIENSPLFAGPGSSHDEFLEYYGIIQGVAPDKRITIRFPDDPSFTEGSAKYDTQKLTPRVPCQPLVLEG